MPIQPNDRYGQDTRRIWGDAGRFPGQPSYRGHRADLGTLSWHDLNALPAGFSSRRHLNTH
ncbi:DNA repair protein [Micromonospora craniellae]|uniref:DNA repair protein n=1 Tax=Micromonospora craniellae TaxID=2294034 RepID=A0A372FW21_9ACTN|nr:DNA repair protein [Micromonospora craniellae]QOC93184.1 DNA repair protein [Micromonospora craniellae]RFS44834.1 DNA repair protein [Micromonospora craniellae]